MPETSTSGYLELWCDLRGFKGYAVFYEWWEFYFGLLSGFGAFEY
jgi:hypothetical protein